MPGLYAPDGGVNRLPKKWITPVGGVNKELKELYGAAGGANRKVFTAGITIGSLSIGDKVKYGKIYGDPIIWIVADKNHSGYPANSVTLVSQKLLKFLPYDAREPSNPDGNRAAGGNDRYDYSNVRHFLNSNASAGTWYAAQHTYDTSPSTSYVYNGYNAYNTAPGFLNQFTAKEISALFDTTYDSKIFEAGTVSLTDKMLLLSCTEIGISSGVVEGSKLALFNNTSYIIANSTVDAATNSTFVPKETVGVAYNWWTRTPAMSSSSNVRQITSSGGITNYSNLYVGDTGLRPACW